jgi:hypothetical protein
MEINTPSKIRIHFRLLIITINRDCLKQTLPKELDIVFRMIKKKDLFRRKLLDLFQVQGNITSFMIKRILKGSAIALGENMRIL